MSNRPTRVAKRTNISKTAAAHAVNTTLNSITSAVKKGDRVALNGIGVFPRRVRLGRNPATGEHQKLLLPGSQNRSWPLLGTSVAECWSGTATSAWKPLPRVPKRPVMTQTRTPLAFGPSKLSGNLVDLVGIEPTTSYMPWKRAPSCATGPLVPILA